ncbi:N-6 DNA methylase [Knoellia remsis]|uniref:site-specific DNA-methyltransferase (adenine-specific) n=1 Tax=Knoellia remsis TaxID=407159 RepID=A0A2T0TQM6_9MICO|nr:type I restriction enzyme HsdR N-terminal domain-containing protein [Knoellia remsis]PRY47818.1 N-6 DNA methylase [Knoellia remsis]
MTFTEALAAYGREARTRLNGPGEPEAALITPVTHLVEQVGHSLGLTVVAHSQVAEQGGAVKPDFGIRVNGILIGHLEVKAPGTSLDPRTYSRSSHNYKQWQRLKELPNLLHTNGTEFRHWSYGEPQGDPVSVHASNLVRAPDPLTAPDRLELVFSDFLRWSPTIITTVSRLVETLAPLARLLREEVQDALTEERRAQRAGADPSSLPFLGIRADWRRLLFPQATDAEFSDGFAQTVVFALLLALDEGIDLVNLSLHDVAQRLEANHTLMGRTLNLLTEHVRNTAVARAIELISRVIGHTDWPRLNARTQNLHLHLYEDFLGTYDPDRRRKSGSYYTPVPVVDAMTRLTDLALKEYMNKPKGLRDANVSIVDPAMGTGTFPLSIIRHVGEEAALVHRGAGAKPEAMSSVVDRLYGIELQSGPFSVAELRITRALREAGVALPANGLNLFVADTLEDPTVAGEQNLPFTAQLIALQRQQANRMKRERNVQVCIGNPPYKDHAGGMGGWIENGTDSKTSAPPLHAFRFAGNGVHERHLSNLYTYFWRWATWKVFESTNEPDITDGGNGVICFITASGYLAGPGFKGMRKYLRRTCSNGWIINVTPEGMQSPNGVFGLFADECGVIG